MKWRAPALGGRFRKADITICIPAYQAASFIDRAIRCAQGQTHSHVRILISVDKSDDNTAEICREFARNDRRIDVLDQSERLGWCGNVNVLLDSVDTEMFFIYFHDDIILPQYCGHLRDALRNRADAASSNCDLLDFGAADNLRPGCTYDGSMVKRILTLWGVAERGTPFRALIRTDRVGSAYRLPPEEQDSLAPGQTLQMRMVAAGPSIRVPETLYLRWQRKDGLTSGWRQLPFERIVEGWKADAARVFKLVDELIADKDERRLLKFAQTSYVLRSLVGPCRTHKRPLPQIHELHPEAVFPLKDGALLDRHGKEISDFLRKTEIELAALQARPAL